MNRARVLRLAILAAVIVALIVVRYTTSFGASLSTTRIRDLVQHAGAAGVGLFIVAFAVGELLHVPGMVFVAAAVLAWGRVGGGALSYVAALVSVSFGFFVVRAIGGQPLATIKQPRVRALLLRVEERPVLTVALLRLLLWLAPVVNYALALSSVRFRDFVLGSALGLVIPVAVAAAFFGVWFR
jgi:uncharacterized membrane protein YdjX (TVP38/TMEM64 family)